MSTYKLKLCSFIFFPAKQADKQTIHPSTHLSSPARTAEMPRLFFFLQKGPITLPIAFKKCFLLHSYIETTHCGTYD